MTLHQLRIFLAVSDAASFARGAQTLYLSQPTVSQHMAALEDELGIILLERSRKGVTLTEAGKELRTHARKLLRLLDEAQQAMKRFRLMEDIPLRVGVSTIPGTYMLPLAFPEIFKTHPELRLSLVQGDSRETVDRVIAEEVELGIVGSRFEQKGLTYTPIGHDVVRLIVAPQHPWASEGKISIAQLASQPLFTREAGSGTGRTVEKALKDSGVDPGALKVRAEMGSTEAQKAAVLSGSGGAFLSQWAVGGELQRGDLVGIEVEGLTIERSFYLVRRTKSSQSAAAAIFSEIITSQWEELKRPTVG